MRIERDHLVTLAIIACMLGVFLVTCWMPTRAAQARYQQRIVDANDLAEANAVKVQSLSALAVEVNQLEQRVANYPRAIRSDNDQGELMRTLSAELTRRNVTDKEIETRRVKTYGTLVEAPIALRFRGGFRDVYSVLERIESLPRLVTVKAVQMEGVARDGDTQQLEVFIELNTYSRSERGGAP